LYKTINIPSYIEIIGITGGIIKIFQIVNNSIGRTMLKILRGCVKTENTIFVNEQKRRIEEIISLKRVESGASLKTLEMTEMGKINIT